MPYIIVPYGFDEEIHGVFFTDDNQHLRQDTEVLEAFNQANAASYVFDGVAIGTGLYARIYRVLFPSLPNTKLNFVAFDAATGDVIGGTTLSMDATGAVIDTPTVAQDTKLAVAVVSVDVAAVSVDVAAISVDIAALEVIAQDAKDGVYADRQYELPVSASEPMQEVWLRQGTAEEILRADLLDENGDPVRDLETAINSAIVAGV